MVPRLIDFDWRVDIKTASNLATTDASSKSGQQTCILQLKVSIICFHVFIYIYIYIL